jgi:hypothetical protein
MAKDRSKTAGRHVTWDTVRELCLSLPGVDPRRHPSEEGSDVIR